MTKLGQLVRAGALVGLAGALGAAPPANASDGAYMWAIGPKIGTLAIPGKFPIGFPTKISNYDFLDEGELAGDPDAEDDKRDLDQDGNPRVSTLERVRDDLQFAVDGFYGINRDNRIGAGAGIGVGLNASYFDYWLTLNYDRVLVTEDQFNVVAGAQAGFGRMAFTGENDNEVLIVPYFPLRVRLQGQIRDNTRMYALGLVAQTGVPSSTLYTDLDGVEQPIKSPLNFLLYSGIGIEAQIMFGDLTPPKKKGKKKNNGGGGGGGGGGR